MEEMPLQHLLALSVIHDSGSITEAAQRLRLSQPALTRALRQLETHVGFTLFERHARGVPLTPSGQAFLAHAQLVQSLTQQTSEAVRQWHRQRPREVRIAAADVPMVELLPSALALLRHSAPDVRVRLMDATAPEIMACFREGLIDLALGPVPPHDPSDRLRIEPLMDAELVVAVAPNTMVSDNATLSCLRHLGWVVQGPLDGLPDPLGDWFARADVEAPRRILSCESASTALQFITAEGFVGLLPEPLARPAQLRGQIRVLSINDTLPSRRMALFYPQTRPLDDAARMLYSAVRLALHHART